MEARPPANPGTPTTSDEGTPAFPTERSPYPYQVGRAISKVRYTHDGMIDLIVEDPSISQNALAAKFGYTPAWVSLVMSSDAFKERLEARRNELIDPAIRASLRERFEALTKRSLEILQEKLAAPAMVVPDGLALKAAELGAKALGLGGNAPPQTLAIPADYLERMGDRLLALQRRATNQGLVIDGQIQEATEIVR